ncbi:MAG: hypothetical protein V3U84_07875 [Thiotrichaceae bacterium]
MFQKIIISTFLVTFLIGCSGNIVSFTTDKILDEIDGTSNHANDPDSNL